MTRVIAVTSGKGGVGKSNFVLNVGISLAMMESSVMILDADLGLANLDVLLGIRPSMNLEDVLLGRAQLRDIIVKTDYHVNLIPGSSGTQDMADIDRDRIAALIKAVKDSCRDTDFLLVDTAAGISSGVVAFLLAVPEVIVGVSPEPTSLTDAYALIKVLKRNGYQGRVSMFASMVKNSSAGHGLFKKISSATQRFLDIQVEYLGSVYSDEKLTRAVSDQVPAIVRFPTSDISRCYRVIALTMLGQKSVSADFEKFWSRLVSMIMKGAKPKAVRAEALKGEAPGASMEQIFHEILDEQRRTRLLLERLVTRIERQGLTENLGKKGYSA
ncbi:MAG TPA: MinD/ParA family protein [Deltaproteobacteria bacterium]|nr:MinD/ParA family protein [Deltaproteobacteria bacterium]